jgi:sugar phosphate isomerase/epimerase
MQMKLGFIGKNDLPGVEADAKFAQEHGFNGLEYNYWAEFKDVAADTIAQMRAIHQRHGVRASMLGIWGWNHLSPDAAVRQAAHAQLDRAIDFASRLGAEVLVTGAGQIPGEPVGRNVAEFVKVFTPILQRVREAGLQLAVYAVHGASFIDSLQTLERLWEAMPDIKLKYDAANWQHHGDDYLAIARRYGHKIGYVHIKDHMTIDGVLASQPAAGMGDIEWGKLMAFLYEHDYRGWLSIEPHGPIWGRSPMREKMILLSRQYIGRFLI